MKSRCSCWVEFAASATQQEQRDFIAHLESTLEETHQEHARANILGSFTKYNRARLNDDVWYGEQYALLWDRDGTMRLLDVDAGTTVELDVGDAIQPQLRRVAFIAR